MYKARKGEKSFFSEAFVRFSRTLGKKTTSKHATYRPHFVVLLLALEHVERARGLLQNCNWNY